MPAMPPNTSSLPAPNALIPAMATPLPSPSHRPARPGRWPGLALAGGLGLLAHGLGQIGWLQDHGLGALTLAILLGMAVGNAWPASASGPRAEGIAWARQRLLRWAIVLYGLRLTFQDIGQIGLAGVAVDAIVLASTFALAWAAGTRLLGLDRPTALLIGAGSSICGAAAVMATQPVVRGRADQAAVAIATVVAFGTVSMFLYPALYALNARHGWVAWSPQAYGLFAGSTIHEVAQVVAAGRAVGGQAADTAVVVKMARVMMLAPFLLALAAWLRRGPDAAPGPRAAGVPWFAFGFIAMAGLHSLGWLPPALVRAVNAADALLLATAMAALGAGTRWPDIRRAGARPMALGALLWAWLVLGGLAIHTGVHALLP